MLRQRVEKYRRENEARALEEDESADTMVALRREAERCRKRATSNELERDRADKRALEVEREVAALTQKLRDEADRYNTLAKQFSEKDSVHAATLRDGE